MQERPQAAAARQAAAAQIDSGMADCTARNSQANQPSRPGPTPASMARIAAATKTGST